MADLFISDLHLDAERPDISGRLDAFLASLPPRTERIFILGDLFEAWIGDDAADALALHVASSLSELASSGVGLFYLHGNRDFLLQRAFAARCSMRLLPDPCVVEIAGEPTVLTHGDALCTDDVAYQRFRAVVRDPQWQQTFLLQSLGERRAFAQRAREASRQHQSAATDSIMDVNADAVARLFMLYGVRRVIHGHTHRPAVHRLVVGSVPCERLVLGDWYEQGSYLSADTDGLRLHALP